MRRRRILLQRARRIAVHDVLTGTYRAIPDPDAPLEESDTLLLAGEDDALRELDKIV